MKLKDFSKTAENKPAVEPKPQKSASGRVRRLDSFESLGLKVMLFGPWGSGKTFAINGLLELGYRVFVLSTDLGGSGLSSVVRHCQNIGKPELLKNLWEIELSGYNDVMAFLERPEKFDPEFYSRNIDILFWDGFSAFQHDIMEFVGQNAGESLNIEKSNVLREEGLQLAVLDWNAVKNATLGALRKFFALQTPGGVWHRFVTCQESVRPKKRSSQSPAETTLYLDERKPMITGQAGALMGAAFDLIVETRVVVNSDDDAEKRKYVYVIETSELVYSKNRGFKLDSVMPGDMKLLWQALAEQAGFGLPALDKSEGA